MKTYDEFVNEANKGTYYEVSYYDAQGGHGSVGDTKDLKSAIKKAEQLKKDEAKRKELGESTLMIEVTSDGPDFAIIYMHKDYLKMAQQGIDDKENLKLYMNAAEECIKTNKTVVAKFKNESVKENLNEGAYEIRTPDMDYSDDYFQLYDKKYSINIDGEYLEVSEKDKVFIRFHLDDKIKDKMEFNLHNMWK